MAKTGREFRVALPHELDQAEQIELAREFAQYLVDRYGVPKPRRNGISPRGARKQRRPARRRS
ncbi:MAG: MobA/MobL family protein [Aliidongia sp.]